MRSCHGVVKATKVDKVNSNAIQNMINKAIDKNATLYTDEATIYKGIAGYRQRMVNHSAAEFVSGAVNTNGIESVWAILKRGYNGAFHHFSDKHIGRYVDEFAFRLNDGNVQIHTWNRIRSLIQGAFGKRLTYRALVELNGQVPFILSLRFVCLLNKKLIYETAPTALSSILLPIYFKGLD